MKVKLSSKFSWLRSLYFESWGDNLIKLFFKNYFTSESYWLILWMYAFLWFHYIIFLGISLSCTHLSDLTLTIVANIFW